MYIFDHNKGRVIGEGGAPSICLCTFPQSVACLLWQRFIRCGNCPDTLQVCQNLFSPCGVVWADLSWKLKASATASIHFIYSCRPGERSRCLLNQRTGRRPLRSALFPIYWVPRQVSVWPVGAVCVRPSSGLALGHRALFSYPV